MKIVCDTSVLIAFQALDKLHVLRKIFSHIIIPQGVYSELKAGEREFNLEDWIEVKEISNIDLYRSLNSKVDEGESETITLALEEKADYILLDDKEARKEAKRIGLKLIGTVGLLLSAKRKGFINSVMEEIEKLEDRIHFRLADDLKQRIVERAGEKGER